jgi:hypothetical protein
MPANGEFNVVQFFKDGQYEYVRRNVSSQAAVEAARHYTSSVAARLGVVIRVIITDGGDQINFEWKRGEGITFPPEARNPNWPFSVQQTSSSPSGEDGEQNASGPVTPNGGDR